MLFFAENKKKDVDKMIGKLEVYNDLLIPMQDEPQKEAEPDDNAVRVTVLYDPLCGFSKKLISDIVGSDLLHSSDIRLYAAPVSIFENSARQAFSAVAHRKEGAASVILSFSSSSLSRGIPKNIAKDEYDRIREYLIETSQALHELYPATPTVVLQFKGQSTVFADSSIDTLRSQIDKIRNTKPENRKRAEQS
jgi:hypothetical protein